MLDENLPTFHSKISSDNPNHTILHFTHNGSDPTPSYLLKHADPVLPASKNQYAVALADCHFPDVIYAEVLVQPEWQQPTLSAAEARSQNAAGMPPAALVPETVIIQLYNPDQQVVVRHVVGSWNKSDSWEFEMPEQSFRRPSASRIDQAASDPPATETVPKVMFRWKRDGRLSKDMSCYMAGRSVGGKKNKEPDITIALFKQGKYESTVTIYEPNLQRVEVEDRKGLDIVLLLGAELIKELYLFPKQDVFNISGAPAGVIANGNRKNSRPGNSPPPQPVIPPLAMSGALNAIPTPKPPPAHQPPLAAQSTSRPDPRSQKDIDAETKRLQAMVAEEERQAKEREKRDRAEQKHIQKMLDEEEKERRKREAEIEKETERLRKQYGVQGQNLHSSSSPPRPNLPPRPTYPPNPQLAVPAHGAWPGSGGHVPPPRPLSAGPYGPPTQTSWWRPNPAPAPAPAVHFAPAPRPQQQQASFQPFQPGKKTKNPIAGVLAPLGPYAGPAAGHISGFFHRDRTEEDKRKVHKKRSTHF